MEALIFIAVYVVKPFLALLCFISVIIAIYIIGGGNAE